MTDDRYQYKVEQINRALAEKPANLKRLRELSVSPNGLINNALRIQVWPKLLGVSDKDLHDNQKGEHRNAVKKHRDWEQVSRDLERSLWKQTGGNDQLLVQKRKELANVIHSIFSSHTELNYFQGYHDIASVLLMVCGEEVAFVLLKKLSFFHIRDYMNDNMDVVMQLLQQLIPLLALVDPAVHQFIVKANLQPFFALSWVLTWFSHSIDDMPVVGRLFDFFFASHPYSVLYMSVAVVLHRKNGLLGGPCEYSAAHNYLSRLPTDLPFEELIQTTISLMKKYPPDQSYFRKKLLALPPKGSKMPPYPFDWIKKSEGSPIYFGHLYKWAPRLSFLKSNETSFVTCIIFVGVVTGCLYLVHLYRLGNKPFVEL